jgi:hypothetical protein
VDVPESAVVDEAQLAFMGVSPDDMADAWKAVATTTDRFATEDGMHRFPLAFQIVTARR